MQVMLTLPALLLLLVLLLLPSGPRYRAIFGNLPEFRKYGSHEFMVACRAKYGPVFKVGGQQQHRPRQDSPHLPAPRCNMQSHGLFRRLQH